MSTRPENHYNGILPENHYNGILVPLNTIRVRRLGRDRNGRMYEYESFEYVAPQGWVLKGTVELHGKLYGMAVPSPAQTYREQPQAARSHERRRHHRPTTHEPPQHRQSRSHRREWR